VDPHKLLVKILNNPRNVNFAEFCRLIESFGFVLDRTSRSHHIYKKMGIRQLINVQNVGGKAKPYQVRQFFEIVEQYNLTLLD
jgi:predicted RNA binding protein YcfA (HicA-like mRNA interferase family)